LRSTSLTSLDVVAKAERCCRPKRLAVMTTAGHFDHAEAIRDSTTPLLISSSLNPTSKRVTAHSKKPGSRSTSPEGIIQSKVSAKSTRRRSAGIAPLHRVVNPIFDQSRK